jgi:hypothetical protein
VKKLEPHELIEMTSFAPTRLEFEVLQAFGIEFYGARKIRTIDLRK